MPSIALKASAAATQTFGKSRRFDGPHPADDLSFMAPRPKRGTGIDYWIVHPSGSYDDDCEAGKRMAEEYLAYVGKHSTVGNSTLLTCIVREMIDRAKGGEEWSGIHVGFLAGINGYAMSMAHMMAAMPKVGAA
jgi:hypothetical protein